MCGVIIYMMMGEYFTEIIRRVTDITHHIRHQIH